jgi:uncharacterized cupredoxin-like copper-binding protein
MIRTFIFGAFAAYVVLAGTAWAGPGASGHGHVEGHHDDDLAFGEPGDPNQPSREITVVMKEEDGMMLFSPNAITVSQGEQIRFKVKNEGVLDHELVVATLDANLKHAEEMAKNPDMEHDDPNAKRLTPGGSGEILWKFTDAGTFDFSCLIPGHREAGMSGSIVVK